MNISGGLINKIKKFLIYTIIIIIIVLAMDWIRNFLLIDKCLDHGGRWNYETSECEGERKQ